MPDPLSSARTVYALVAFLYVGLALLALLAPRKRRVPWSDAAHSAGADAGASRGAGDFGAGDFGAGDFGAGDFGAGDFGGRDVRLDRRLRLLVATVAGLTAAWAALVAADRQAGTLADALWLAQALGWIDVVLSLSRFYAASPGPGLRPLQGGIRGAGAAIVLLALLGPQLLPAPPLAGLLVDARLVIALASLVVAENVLRNADANAHWHLAPPAIALGAMGAFTLLIYGDAALHHRLSGTLFAGRAILLILLVPLLLLAARRHRQWRRRLSLSHAAVFYSATLILGGAFLAAIGLIGIVLDRYGASWAQLVELTLFVAALLGMALLLSSGSARSRLRILLIENFLSQRYDYRREWLRCLSTLATDHATSLQVRAVRTLADTLDSPAGALYLRGTGADRDAFRLEEGWNAGHPPARLAADAPWLAELLAKGICRLDQAAAAAIAADNDRLRDAFLAVSLAHPDGGGVFGLVVLDAPRAAAVVDAEVLTLMRVVAREVALVLAERQSAEALATSRRFEAAGKRFAFVAHDIKNVANQLALVIDNAEHHLDDPEFREDMMATLREAVGKIGTLVRRIREPDAGERNRCEVGAHVARLVERTGTERGIAIRIEDRSRPDAAAAAVPQGPDRAAAGESVFGDAPLRAVIEPAAFDRILAHLLDNAVDASADGGQVTIAIGAEGGSVTVEVIDCGAGMSAEFIRDRLFRPFTSSKGGGFGLGAYQARELARLAGGDLTVTSAPGAGTTMTLRLQRLEAAQPSGPTPALAG